VDAINTNPEISPSPAIERGQSNFLGFQDQMNHLRTFTQSDSSARLSISHHVNSLSGQPTLQGGSDSQLNHSQLNPLDSNTILLFNPQESVFGFGNSASSAVENGNAMCLHRTRYGSPQGISIVRRRLQDALCPPLTPEKIVGIGLVTGMAYDVVLHLLVEPEKSGNIGLAKTITPQVERHCFGESTSNQFTPRPAFRVTKRGKGTNKRKTTDQHQSELRIPADRWNVGRTPASIHAKAAELSKQNLYACTKKLSQEQLQENRQKPWDRNKPYSCPLLCGKAWKNASDFERHARENQPQFGFVCNLHFAATSTPMKAIFKKCTITKQRAKIRNSN
jgi:hypothetical protein